MLTKRIIPCLDIRDGRTVKGINFENIIDAGDPVELAKRYIVEGADELVFLDITATIEKRKTLINLVQKISENIDIPFTVGGGISEIEDIRELLNGGADKISINSAAVRDPHKIRELSDSFGSQCIVVAIDTKFINNEWRVFIDGGRTDTGLNTKEWAYKCNSLGAGEILLTSMNNDGTKSGFALNITSEVTAEISIPVIASGGAGTLQHFLEVFTEGNAEAALAASIFHFSEIKLTDLKTFLFQHNIHINPV